MTADIEADTAAFRAAARRLANASPELRRELAATLRKAGKPLGEWTALKGASRMPRTGGLQEELANASVSVTVTVGNNPKARITVTSRKKYDLAAIDRGRLRHPVFAKAGESRSDWTWVNQQVAPNAYRDAFRSGAAPVAQDITNTIERFAERLEGDLGA